jgi:hypothetical protein
MSASPSMLVTTRAETMAMLASQDATNRQKHHTSASDSFCTAVLDVAPSSSTEQVRILDLQWRERVPSTGTRLNPSTSRGRT